MEPRGLSDLDTDTAAAGRAGFGDVRRIVSGVGIGLFAVAVGLLAVGCAGTTVTKTVTEPSVKAAATTKPGRGAPRELVLFGHIESLTRKGDQFELRFDPAWFLSGETANRAAAEDGAVEPGQPVPNDNYVVEEGHRSLTYLVPTDAEVTVLTRGGDPAQLGATPITVVELAQIVEGTSRLELFEPLDSGVWIRVEIDAVRAIDQQYRP